MEQSKSITLALTGASGAPYGLRLAELLLEQGIEIHLLLSDTAPTVIRQETGRPPEEWLAELSPKGKISLLDNKDFSAPIASGSYPNRGMVVAPCSMGTLGRIASGLSSNLIERAADVTLKERRRLILLCRETPLSSIHLENMVKVDRAGGIIMPPVPAFYSGPQTIADLVNQTCYRVMDLMGLPLEKTFRWGAELD
ncbi:MAG: UbiX family flavin prenyltransferase [Spirochaetales bacterium]|nr:UbiX family flavin prenyltransferase [Spirochaetales bacterium]